jgi:hypothetical protein
VPYKTGQSAKTESGKRRGFAENSLISHNFSKVYFPMAGFKADFITGLTFTSKITLK